MSACTKKTKNGRKCKAPAMKGRRTCMFHSKSSRPNTKGRRRK